MGDAAQGSGIRTFGPFALDSGRGCLLANGVEVPLRPKTFALLCHLAANPGRLVSKDELIAVVWRGALVGDDVLVQSVGELRRALGAAGADLIRTVPRRGYRFEAEVAMPPGSGPPPAAPSLASVAVSPGVAAGPPSGMARPRWPLLAALIVLIAALSVIALIIPSLQDGGRASGGQGRTGPVIAVLPFSNIGADPKIAIDLNDKLIAALDLFSALTVKSGGTVQARLAGAANPAGLAHTLDLQYLIEGTAAQRAGGVVVSGRLVDWQGDVLWSGDFDEEHLGQFAAEVATVIQHSEERIAAAKPPRGLTAYDYVQRARHRMRSTDSPQGIMDGIAWVREQAHRATGLDPGFAPAWTLLAEVSLAKATGGYAESGVRELMKAEEAANHARALDPQDVRAHVVLAHVYLASMREQPAQVEAERLQAINPNDPHGLAARGVVLVYLGQTDAAIQALESVRRISRRLDTLKSWDEFSLSLAYYLKGRYEDARLSLGPMETIPENVPPLPEFVAAPAALLAACLAMQGHPEEARKAADIARNADPALVARMPLFSSKLRSPADRRRLEEGLVRAGLLAAP